MILLSGVFVGVNNGCLGRLRRREGVVNDDILVFFEDAIFIFCDVVVDADFLLFILLCRTIFFVELIVGLDKSRMALVLAAETK